MAADDRAVQFFGYDAKASNLCVDLCYEKLAGPTYLLALRLDLYAGYNVA